MAIKILKLKLQAEDAEWLQGKAEEMGLLNADDYVRVLVREARNGKVNHVVHAGGARDIPDRHIDLPRVPLRHIPNRDLAAEDTYVPGEDFEMPPDADGGDPSDELMAAMRMMTTAFEPPPQGKPGQVTRPAGVAGNPQGALGNIVRENFGHLGFRGGKQ